MLQNAGKVTTVAIPQVEVSIKIIPTSCLNSVFTKEFPATQFHWPQSNNMWGFLKSIEIKQLMQNYVKHLPFCFWIVR